MVPDTRIAAACLQTSYHIFVSSDESLTLRIGEASAGLEALLRTNNAQQFAYLTAYNPRSTTLQEEENLQRHLHLCAMIERLGYRYLPGEATSDGSHWPAETCLFVFDMDWSDTWRVCDAYEQDVAVIGRRGETPRIFWIAHGPPAD